MTDLVAELRKRAERIRATQGADGLAVAFANGYEKAMADSTALLEADPLYQGAPRMRDLLQEAEEWYATNGLNRPAFFPIHVKILRLLGLLKLIDPPPRGDAAMTDPITKLRWFAANNEEQARQVYLSDDDAARHATRAKAYRDAAALVEADPLYKAAPKMAQKLREIRAAVLRTYARFGSTARLDAQLADLDALLATLPPEKTPP